MKGKRKEKGKRRRRLSPVKWECRVLAFVAVV